MEIIIKKDTSFYHSSNNFKGLYEGSLIYFSNDIRYQYQELTGVEDLVKTFTPCCNYNLESPCYRFISVRDLRMLKLTNELEMNILQMMLYFLNFL